MSHFRANRYLLTSVFIITLCCNSDTDAETYQLQVTNGEGPRLHSFVRFVLPEDLQPRDHFQLREAGSSTALPVQKTSGPDPELIWKLNRPLKPREKRVYALTIQKSSVRSDVRARNYAAKNEKTLTLYHRQKPVLVYNMATLPSHDPQKPYYARSGHIHPLYNPLGQVVTDDFSPNHPHQHGLFFAWTRTNWSGRDIDFWNQAAKLGTIAHDKLIATKSGPVFAGFKAALQHRDITDPKSKRIALNETWDVHVFKQGKAFLIDLTSNQTAVQAPLKVKQYHYGGFAIRGHRKWNVEAGCEFLTSENKSRLDGNHTRPRWVSMSGPIEGDISTITIFDHPDNFRYPQPVRLHPKMPYFCFAPLVLGEFEIGTEKPYQSRYRLAVTLGKPDRSLLEQLWADYSQPLKAEHIELPQEQ